MKTKEEILQDFGCGVIPHGENVTMYYPAILSAMDEYADQFKPRWVPVTERLPEEGALCAIQRRYSNDIGVQRFNGVCFTNYQGYAVTHYFVITEPPKTENE